MSVDTKDLLVEMVKRTVEQGSEDEIRLVGAMLRIIPSFANVALIQRMATSPASIVAARGVPGFKLDPLRSPAIEA